MNRKILFSVAALPLSAIVAFGLVVVSLAITGTYNSNKLTIGYFIFGGAGLLYLLSLLFIWTRKSGVVPTQIRPWNYFSVFILSSLFGPGAGYLITWQNLLRMGKAAEAKQFLLFGGAVFLLMSVGFFLLPQDGIKLLGNVASIGFPIWLYYAYQKQWQTNNPNQAKFSWSVIGWALLGLIVLVVLFIPLGMILHK